MAKTITVTTINEKKLNEFILDWDDLMASSGGAYQPRVIRTDEETIRENGTVIALTGLKRKSPLDLAGLADSLSRIFIFDKSFNLFIEDDSNGKIKIDNLRKYGTLKKEFSWTLPSQLFVPKESGYFEKLSGEFHTSEKPISPASGLRGVTLYSRGKLVNAPEFFSTSASSNFYQYLTGWISVDFVDLLPDDVISTNRQSIDWENPEMEALYKFLSGIVSQINADWRSKRKTKKDSELKTVTGIDTAGWMETMPEDVRENTKQIIEALGSEDTFEKYTPVIKALHEIVPEYPLLHWRHLHQELQIKSKQYYQSGDYYTAFTEAVKKYAHSVKQKSGSSVTPDHSMMGAVFKDEGDLKVIGNYKRGDGTNFSSDTIKNIQAGQQQLSQGVIIGGRNPLSHEEITELKTSGLFSENDCLDLLSLVSHLFKRLDNSVTP